MWLPPPCCRGRDSSVVASCSTHGHRDGANTAVRLGWLIPAIAGAASSPWLSEETLEAWAACPLGLSLLTGAFPEISLQTWPCTLVAVPACPHHHTCRDACGRVRGYAEVQAGRECREAPGLKRCPAPPPDLPGWEAGRCAPAALKYPRDGQETQGLCATAASHSPVAVPGEGMRPVVILLKSCARLWRDSCRVEARRR